MKPNRALVTVVLVLGLGGLLAAACGSGDTIVNSSTTTQIGISISGVGRAVGNPDIVFLTLGVNLERETVAAAREDAASAMRGVIASLRSNGVDEDDIQTTQFSIQPQYNFSNRIQTLRGYRVTNVVNAKITEVDTAGEVIDGAATAGGGAVVVQSIRFAIDDPTELQKQARKAAVAEAKARAEELADHAGVKLGRPVSITDGFPSVLPQAFVDRAELAVETTPIQAGELEITVSVNILYAIE